MFDLAKAKEAGTYREFKRTFSFGKYIRFESKNLLNLASNDYLGIATNRNLRDEFLKTVAESDVFFGSGASRLVYNSSEAFFRLEKWFEARFSKKALFIADKLIHASMIDALKLSQANFKRYPHGDTDALESLLEKFHGEFERIIILTEAVFSMDGDEADLKKLVALKKNYDNVKLYVDEAHSFFALHELGLCKKESLEKDIDYIHVTLSKALGGSGAVLLSDEETHEVLVNSARSLIFSTAMPSIDVAWTHFVIQRDFSAERKNLREGIRLLGLSQTQICPFIVGENEKTVALSEKLREAGYFVAAIRPPTVPQNTARLRISLRGDILPSELESFKEILDAYSGNLPA